MSPGSFDCLQTGAQDMLRRGEALPSRGGVGHYGSFRGSKWRNRIAPMVEQWIAVHT